MNKLIIPPSPNWYESYALACAPDNTIIYGTRNEIVVIFPKPPEEPADVKTIAGIHTQRVVGVVVNPGWGKPSKLAVSVAEDNVVRLLDIETCTSKLAHVGHTTRSDKVVGATFAGDDKVISVSEDGFIIVWRLGANHLTSITDILGSRAKVTCVSSCPHASWMIAFGLKKGTIIITDLRKSGKVLYRLSGHDTSITSLSWCPAPFNIFPKKVKKAKEIKSEDSGGKTKTENNVTDNLKAADCLAKSVYSIFIGESKDVETLKLDDVSQENSDESLVNHSNRQLEIDSSKKTELHETSDFKEDRLENDGKSQEDMLKEEVSSSQIMSNEHTEQSVQIDIQNSTDIVISIATLSESSEYQLNAENEKLEDNGEPQQISDQTGLENGDSELNVKSNLLEEENDVKKEETQEIHQNTEVPDREFLLASTARGGGSIKIWRAGTDGFLQTELYIPGKPRQSRSSRTDDKSWIAMCWITPKDLLSSSYKGELLHWKFPFQVSADGKVNKWRLIHGDHHKHIFCIAAPTKIYESLVEENWRNRCPFNAWTMGKDRFILNTSLNADHKTLALYPTIGGIISCMAASPIDPSRIALATGEGTCRTWDLSRSHLQHIVMTQLSDKNQIKISSLAWHPLKEVCLAFGTLDGRVGLIDTNHTTKGIKFLVQSCHGTVYKIEWGPLNGDRNVLGLYAVSSGSLIAYDVNKALHEPTKFDFEENCVTHFAWKPDFSILAVGTKTGDVMLYSTKLKLLTTLLLQNKGVRWMTWHPEGTPEDSWLAVSTNHVIVYDCSSVNENSTKQTNYGECTVAIFTEHTHYVQCLAWSPHEGGMLASASEDGTALVWNVKTNTLLHSCVTNNLDMLNTVLWSPLDPDYIITGGRDCMIQIWKLSENPPKQKIGKKVKQKVLKLEGEEETTNDNTDTQKTGGALKKSRKYLLAGIAQTQNPNFQSSLLVDCERLFTFLYENTKNDEYQNEQTEKQVQFDALQLFGNKEDIDALLQLERTGHPKKTVPLYYESIELWQGDIGNTIKKAVAEGTLNAHLVAIAPMISFSLWQEACEAYANQLSEATDSRPVEAAYFYLACHKVKEAIEALCNASYYREALILAKCRLQAGDPLINEILERWAKFCTAVGNFEVTAQCYIALNRLEDATKALFRRSDVPTLKFCTKLAERSNNKDLLEATQFRLNAFSGSEPVEEDEMQWELVSRGELELIRSSQRSLAKLGENPVPDKAGGGDISNANNDIIPDVTGNEITESKLADVPNKAGGGDISDANNDMKPDTTGNKINGTESNLTDVPDKAGGGDISDANNDIKPDTTGNKINENESKLTDVPGKDDGGDISDANNDMKPDTAENKINGTESKLTDVPDKACGGDISDANNDIKPDRTSNKINGTESKLTGDGQPVIDQHDE